MGKTHSKPLAARHGRGMAWAQHAMCELAVNVLLLKKKVLLFCAHSMRTRFLGKKLHKLQEKFWKINICYFGCLHSYPLYTMPKNKFVSSFVQQ
jgi:hypothetical protein